MTKPLDRRRLALVFSMLGGSTTDGERLAALARATAMLAAAGLDWQTFARTGGGPVGTASRASGKASRQASSPADTHATGRSQSGTRQGSSRTGAAYNQWAADEQARAEYEAMDAARRNNNYSEKAQARYTDPSPEWREATAQTGSNNRGSSHRHAADTDPASVNPGDANRHLSGTEIPPDVIGKIKIQDRQTTMSKPLWLIVDIVGEFATCGPLTIYDRFDIEMALHYGDWVYGSVTPAADGRRYPTLSGIKQIK